MIKKRKIENKEGEYKEEIEKRKRKKSQFLQSEIKKKKQIKKKRQSRKFWLKRQKRDVSKLLSGARGVLHSQCKATGG